MLDYEMWLKPCSLGIEQKVATKDGRQGEYLYFDVSINSFQAL